jgi:hypothetical protein
MIELLLPCGFGTLEYSWVKATIGICTLVDYSVAKKCQQPAYLKLADKLIFLIHANDTSCLSFDLPYKDQACRIIINRA